MNDLCVVLVDRSKFDLASNYAENKLHICLTVHTKVPITAVKLISYFLVAVSGVAKGGKDGHLPSLHKAVVFLQACWQ